MEAIQCNLVSQAILARSHSLLQRALKAGPRVIDEANLFGQTSLHPAALLWPSGLKYLIEAGANIEATDHSGHSPFAYALVSGSVYAVRLLEDLDCQINPSLLKDFCRAEVQAKAIQSMVRFESEVDTLILTLARRRRKLETLTKACLNQSMVNELKLSPERVLDGHVRLALRFLQNQEIPVPDSLLCTQPYNETVFFDVELNTRQAEALWGFGFRDIDNANSLGLHSLMNRGFSASYEELERELELPYWYLSKGTSLHARQCQAFQRLSYNEERSKDFAILTQSTSLLTISHYYGTKLGITPKYRQKRKWIGEGRVTQLSRHAKDAALLVLDQSIHDGCLCACSVGGCCALTMLLKESCEQDSPKSTGELDPLWDSDDFCWNEVVALDGLWLQATRFLTFKALRLKHTCCRRAWYQEREIIAELGDEEEMQGIREEQEEQVEMLESVLAELEDKYRQLGIPFTDFIQTFWKQRMEQATRTEDLIDEGKLREIGVVLKEG